MIAALLLLVVSVVGFARSAAFVVNAADDVGRVGQIAPERASPTGNAVTAGSSATAVNDASPSPSGSGGSESNPSALPPVAAPSASTPSATGGSESAVEAVANEIGAEPVVGAAGALGGGAGGGGAAVSSSAGAAGAAPSLWDEAVQSVFGFLARNTISMCGANTCNVGQVCCNASCGVCVAQGSTCDKTQCTGAPRIPTAVLCGRAQCNDGQVCCNASCGVCTAPGDTCDDKKCE